MNAHDVEAIIQVGAKSAAFNLGGQLLVGRRRDSRGEASRTRRADRQNFLAFDRRNNFAWVASDNSPISSRKTVPRPAEMNKPS